MEESENEMNRHLARIDKALNSPWRAFVRGTFQGLGAIIGAAALLVVTGWILNFVGVIPAFHDGVDEFRQILLDIRAAR